MTVTYLWLEAGTEKKDTRVLEIVEDQCTEVTSLFAIPSRAILEATVLSIVGLVKSSKKMCGRFCMQTSYASMSLLNIALLRFDERPNLAAANTITPSKRILHFIFLSAVTLRA